MSSKMARRTKNFIMRTVGRVGKLPRLVNKSKGPAGGLEIYGYVDVNANATTPFSRGKVHKGYLCCQPSELSHGDLVYDRYDNKHYFVMSMKGKLYNDETVYIDATMYMCDSVVSILRFGQTGARDTFGRAVDPNPATIAESVQAMFNPRNYGTMQQEDRLIPQNKIQICVQSSTGVKVADRIVSDTGVKYIVQSIDDVSLENLVLCAVDMDVR